MAAQYFPNNIQTLLNISFLIVTTFTKVVCTPTDPSYHIRSIIIVYQLIHFLKWQTNSFPHTKNPLGVKKIVKFIKIVYFCFFSHITCVQ